LLIEFHLVHFHPPSTCQDKVSNFEMESIGTTSAPPSVAPSRVLNASIREQGKSTHNQTVVRKGPPVIPAPPGNARGGPSFAKLNLDDSDDIGDFDDGRIVQVSSELGKRDRMDSPGKGEQNEAGRPARRLVCSCRRF
jgi:hypothetical protein